MLHAKTGISYQSLERDLQNLPEEKQMEIAVPPPSEIGTDKYKKAARVILAAKLFSAPYAGNCDLEGIKFEDDVHKIIAEYIIKCEKNAERVRPSELFEILDEDCPEFNEILDLNYGTSSRTRSRRNFFRTASKRWNGNASANVSASIPAFLRRNGIRENGKRSPERSTNIPSF